MRANRTAIALGQLALLAIAIAALAVMAISGHLDPEAVTALFGVVIGHVGIVAYNGATKGDRSEQVQGDAELVAAATGHYQPPQAPVTGDAPHPGL